MKRKGFTLIEILVVIAIITILVSIVIAVGVAVRTNGQRTATRIVLRDLTTILSSYQQEKQQTPPDINTMIAIGIQMPQIGRAIQSIPSSELQHIGSTYYVNDGFGNQIQLITTGPRSPYFQSAGPDGIMGTVDDMYSYDP